jgi:hypothetical protein
MLGNNSTESKITWGKNEKSTCPYLEAFGDNTLS